MHLNISVAVPTRHRPIRMTRFTETLNETTLNSRPHLTVLYDDINEESASRATYSGPLTEMYLKPKHGLTSLWNQGIISSPTDWVFVCNDDIEFRTGWLEYLEDAIQTTSRMIHLFHYGAFCIHKSFILKVGWFDERFKGGGFEDCDYQLRIFEAECKSLVDKKKDFTGGMNAKREEVAPFIKHTKYVYAGPLNAGKGWRGMGNGEWFLKKWGHRHLPKQRTAGEPDWYPRITEDYRQKFGIEPEWLNKVKESLRTHKNVSY